MADDRASRARRRQALQQERDALRGRVKQVDEVLVRARALAPATTAHQQDGRSRQ